MGEDAHLNVGFKKHLTLCLDRERVPPWLIIQIDHLLEEKLRFVLVSLSEGVSLRKLVNSGEFSSLVF